VVGECRGVAAARSISRRRPCSISATVSIAPSRARSRRPAAPALDHRHVWVRVGGARYFHRRRASGGRTRPVPG
jgi:hypothetical protein